MKRDRNHLYLYTVDVLEKGKWVRMQVEAFNIHQAAHKLEKKIDHVRYVTKYIL